jgi:hypothetical protein
MSGRFQELSEKGWAILPAPIAAQTIPGLATDGTLWSESTDGSERKRPRRCRQGLEHPFSTQHYFCGAVSPSLAAVLFPEACPVATSFPFLIFE